MGGVKTTLGNLTETAKTMTTEKEVIELREKVLINKYYFYVMDCIKFKKEILIGSTWYDEIYKKDK